MVPPIAIGGRVEGRTEHVNVALAMVKEIQDARRASGPDYFDGGESPRVLIGNHYKNHKSDPYRALIYYESEIAQEPENFIAAYNAALAHYDIYCKIGGEEGGREAKQNRKLAVEFCEKALEVRPDCAEAIELLYEIKLNQGKQEEAEELLEQLTELHREIALPQLMKNAAEQKDKED